MADIDYHEGCIVHITGFDCSHCGENPMLLRMTNINLFDNECEIRCDKCFESESVRIFETEKVDMIIKFSSKGNEIHDWKGKQYLPFAKKYLDLNLRTT